MLHYHAAAVWRTYGVPFDRLPDLWWDDWLLMCERVESDARHAERGS